MYGELDLVVDCGCEIYGLLQPWCIESFWDFGQCEVRSDRIYVIGRKQFKDYKDLIRDLVMQDVRVIFSNPFEGSETLRLQIEHLGMADLFYNRKILLIGGGEMSAQWPYLLHEHFLSKVHDFEENCRAAERSDEIYEKLHKPYTFLFLNGRGRAHRKWMIECLDHCGLLSGSLYTWLDSSHGVRRDLDLILAGENLMARPREWNFLPVQYETPRYRDRSEITAGTVFAKYELFNQEWGDIYIQPEQYIDTYFSLVTETVHAWPYSFRTEKIWKPMAMAHPWICVANQGFYRDLRNLGFQTFHGIIDESFDSIENNHDRLQRVYEIVKNICQSGLVQFMQACESVCKYNQQHMMEIRQPVLQRFPEDFFQFLRKYQWTI